METKNKRIVNIEIDDEVKKLTIEGVDKDQQVVMREELSDDDLDAVAGGWAGNIINTIFGDSNDGGYSNNYCPNNNPAVCTGVN
ncbi:MAG: hypothetical protein IKP48_10580 [Bacteroidaceae bacterium]|nr:hypothetical protein [Bacteroidaceae bacterium]